MNLAIAFVYGIGMAVSWVVATRWFYDEGDPHTGTPAGAAAVGFCFAILWPIGCAVLLLVGVCTVVGRLALKGRA